jgi:hypothetical protein
MQRNGIREQLKNVARRQRTGIREPRETRETNWWVVCDSNAGPTG